LVIKRSTSGEVSRLIADVLGSDAVRREAAVARLTIIGSRAVERLIATLPTVSDAGGRAAMLQVLERIGDVRALGAGEDASKEIDPGVAGAGIAILRALQQAPQAEAATRALERLTDVALDRQRSDGVRAAALDALHDLAPAIVEPLLERLRDDPSAAIRRLAGLPDQPGGGHALPTSNLSGSPTLEQMVDGALPADAELVKKLVTETGAAVPLPILHRLIAAIRSHERSVEPSGDRSSWAVARGAAHHALALRGSRVALYDARETLEASPDLISVGMLAALAEIGDASCLEPMADAIARTKDEWLRSQLTAAFHRIRARERLTRRHAVIKRLAGKHPELLGS
jgi:hypothetical protein